MKIEPRCVNTLTEYMIPEKLHTEMHYVCESLMKDINSQKDEVFLEALKRKGFDFTDKPRHELEDFIKACCRCEDNTHHKEQVFYVFNKPFLVYDYSKEMDLKWDYTDNNTTVSVEAGSYRFV